MSPHPPGWRQTPTVPPSTGQLGADSAALRRRLEDAICDPELKWTRDTAAAAERILADTELLDAIATWHNQRQAAAMLAQLGKEARDRLEKAIFGPDPEPYPIPLLVKGVAALMDADYFDITERGDAHLLVTLPNDDLVRISFALTDITERPTID
ncbi:MULTISPECIES: hypothetical protein [Nocardia]|uniref:hypothetical protein n=1 Tax=Nocardia TaxID=1817 RepID=UPI0024545FD0|nr:MULTISPECIES: hypothetical protein [Nocardia]